MTTWGIGSTGASGYGGREPESGPLTVETALVKPIPHLLKRTPGLRWGLVFVLILIAAILTGCSDSQPPNLILITLDTVRADHLGCYQSEGPSTPRLDALAAEGLIFTRAYTPYPLTLPAHASLLGGLLPFEHGIRNNDMPLAGDAAPLVQERLRQQGYATAAVISAFVLDRRFGLARGFDHYLDAMPQSDPGGEPAVERRGDATTDLALGLLDELGSGPFFLWVHYFDPHSPYTPPPPYQGTGYAGEISYTDAEVGRLLDGLIERGLYRDAAVIVAGDHGEAFGEHGEVEHGFFIYDTTLHVPLIDATRGMINAERLRLMRPKSVLLNFARGEIVEDEAFLFACHPCGATHVVV